MGPGAAPEAETSPSAEPDDRSGNRLRSAARITVAASALGGVITPGPDLGTYVLSLLAVGVAIASVAAWHRPPRSERSNKWAAIAASLRDDGPPVIKSVAPRRFDPEW